GRRSQGCSGIRRSSEVAARCAAGCGHTHSFLSHPQTGLHPMVPGAVRGRGPCLLLCPNGDSSLQNRDHHLRGLFHRGAGEHRHERELSPRVQEAFQATGADHAGVSAGSWAVVAHPRLDPVLTTQESDVKRVLDAVPLSSGLRPYAQCIKIPDSCIANLSFRATHLLGQVETRNDQTYVAPALLPVLASSKSDTLRRQECLRHTILEAPYFVIGSAEREEYRGFSSWQGSVGILHPLKRVQNDKVPELLEQQTKVCC